MSQPAHEASENRKVQYRHLLDQVSELRKFKKKSNFSQFCKINLSEEAEQTGPDITDRLIEIIEQTNALFSESTANKNLPTSEECLLDAKVVTTVSDVLVYVAEAVDCSIDSYNYLDFAKKIVNIFYNNIKLFKSKCDYFSVLNTCLTIMARTTMINLKWIIKNCFLL